MSTHRVQYLLPCGCGGEVRIDASQAGLRVACACGRELEAPSFRGLSRLQKVEAPAVAAADAAWTIREGLLLVGGIMILIGLGPAIWLRMSPPALPAPEEIIHDYRGATIGQRWADWLVLQTGPEYADANPLVEYVTNRSAAFERETVAHRRTTMTVLIVAGVGVAVCSLGVGLGLRGRAPPRTVARRPASGPRQKTA